MSEIYWITRMDGVNTFLTICEVVISLAFVWCAVTALFADGSEQRMSAVKDLIRTGVVALIVGFMLVFIPTTKEMLLIYGVGGTIDYIKCNDTAKGLPDKAIKALDKYLDELSKDKQDEEDNVQ